MPPEIKSKSKLAEITDPEVSLYRVGDEPYYAWFERTAEERRAQLPLMNGMSGSGIMNVETGEKE